MDLLPNAIARLKGVTIPFARHFIEMVQEDKELLRETELLVNHYIDYVLRITLWALSGQDPLEIRTAPVLFHPKVQSMHLNEEEIAKYVMIYIQASMEQLTPDDFPSLTSAWTVVFLHDLHEGAYILEFSVHNQDRNSDDPSFIASRIMGEDLDDGVQIFQHKVMVHCYEFTLIVPVLLLVVKEDVKKLDLFVEYSSHLTLSHVNLVKLHHRSGRWIDTTQ